MNEYELERREWWVERWLELLDAYRFKKRLERARRYAHEGNVMGIEFKGSKVLAKVQGTDTEPYLVSLSLSPFTNEDWNYVIEMLSQKAIYSAQLLAGEMPDNIEEVFTANGLSLFPFSLADIHARCTCPDQANPCKHIGAVYYDLGDRFSEDPFVLFQLRGRTKTQILEALRLLRAKEIKNGSKKQRTDKEGKKHSDNQKTPLDLEQFWEYEEAIDPSLVRIVPATEPKSLLDRLGPIPLASADAAAIRQYLEQVYPKASQKAVAVASNRDEN